MCKLKKILFSDYAALRSKVKRTEQPAVENFHDNYDSGKIPYVKHYISYQKHNGPANIIKIKKYFYAIKYL